VSLGRTRIAFAGGASDHWPEFRLRHSGYVEALREAGLEPDPALQVDAQSSEAAGYEAAVRMLDSGRPFDAVFAASDRIAMGVIGALRDRGLAVPGDVAVVGFDDIVAAAHFSPPLTTVHQDTELAGEMLVDNLLRLISGESLDSALVPPRLVVRKSCGAGAATR